MWIFKLGKQPPRPLNKSYFTVGSGTGFDSCLPRQGDEDQVLFTLHSEGHRLTLVPGSEKILVNGKALSRPTILQSCDRIECRGIAGAVLEGPLELGEPSSLRGAGQALDILREMTAALSDEAGWHGAVARALERLVFVSGAEQGSLVTESAGAQSWELIAEAGESSTISRDETRRQIVSSTVVAEALRTGKPVYVESLIGHPWEAQASLMAARVFSLACLPLVVGGRALGCVCLYTRTPGRAIQQEKLEDLQLLATQFALLLATKAETTELRREAMELRGRAEKKRWMIYAPGSPMEAIEARVARLSGSELSVLVGGETGSGKELVAREIHRASARSKGPFVALNCGAIPPTLIESTLFGYVKGAFTGALKDHPGKLLQADGGTLFLDEIGDLPLDLQVRLLRVLQDKLVEPVGAAHGIPVDFRVVAATHRDLRQLVSEGKFREDLFYRLNGAAIEIPPLRARRSDVAVLASHFLDRERPGARLSANAIARLESHGWQGNVRELEQAIRRAAVLADSDDILVGDLELGEAGPTGASLQASGQPTSLKGAQDAFTRELVKRALETHGGNRAKAAQDLGISERTLYRILSDDSTDTSM